MASFAQRSCDLQVTMSSPTAGTNITSGQPFNLSYVVKNNGPDALKAGDTAIWALTINNAIVNGSAFFSILTTDVAKDGIVVTYNQNQTFTFGTNTANANLCAVFSATNRSFGVAKVADAVPTNNTGCVVVNMKTAGIKSIGKGLALATEINASPNPANESVNISYTLVNPATVTITLFDMSGRQVLESITDKQGAGANTMHFNTSELNAGMYFYEVRIGDQAERYKLMVN